ncbi:MAG: phage protein Gp36 family protein, partial [Candidatus Sericytochromatia bacterium]
MHARGHGLGEARRVGHDRGLLEVLSGAFEVGGEQEPHEAPQERVVVVGGIHALALFQERDRRLAIPRVADCPGAEPVGEVELRVEVRDQIEHLGQVDGLFRLVDAQAIAEAHIASRYALPLATVPRILEMAVGDLARARLYPR